MKKLVLLFALATAFTFANGQGRSVDLSVSSISKPDRIPSGGPIDFNFTVKNGGTDALKAGDSIFYQIIMLGGQLVLPNGSFFATTLAKDVNSGDSTSTGAKININVNFNNSGYGSFCIFAIGVNRSTDSLKIETSGTIQDNLLCRQTRYGDWDADINKINVLTGVNVYPNPAHGLLNLTYTTERASDVTIRLTDLTGREVISGVKQRQQSGINIEQINTENLPAGVYIYQVNIDGKVQSGKVTIE